MTACEHANDPSTPSLHIPDTEEAIATESATTESVESPPKRRPKPAIQVERAAPAAANAPEPPLEYRVMTRAGTKWVRPMSRGGAQWKERPLEDRVKREPVTAEAKQ